jgi:hypothetical protein
MSGHEFEKQVRQKIFDLKMSPSMQAWENIEEKLKERKRRPVAFYWVPLLLVGLAAGGYFMLNREGEIAHSTIVHASPQEKTNTNAPTIENNETASSNSQQHELQSPEKVISINKNKELSSLSIISANTNNQVASKDIFNDVSNSSHEINNTYKNSDKAITSRNMIPDIALMQPEKNTSAITPGKFLKLTYKPVASPDAKQSITNNQRHINSKWSYGLSAMAGISAVNEGHLLNFNNAEVEDVARVPSFAPRPPYKPSSISPGLSFSGGLFVNRVLNRRFSLSLGVNYLQLNTLNKVGSQINGSQIVNNGTRGYILVSNYFTVDEDRPSEYRNRYHFIEVPLEVDMKLNQSRKTPLHVNTGVAVSHMLKSNSLHFDGTTGVYYKNDNLVNQTQVALKTGVSVGILNRTTRPLWIGPSAKYYLSKILQKDVSARKNFMSLGVDVKMFIR